MCELPAHIKGNKRSCASEISSPANAIIMFHVFWPGMWSALDYGEFLIRIVADEMYIYIYIYIYVSYISMIHLWMIDPHTFG